MSRPGFFFLTTFSFFSLSAGAAERPPEEIIINAPTPLSRLKFEINEAEDAMFAVYNDLNDDDRFDIHCRYEKRWQSKIEHRVCSPNYFKTAQVEEVNNFLGQIGYVGASKGGAGVSAMDHFNAILKEKMTTIFEEHPEFRQAMSNLNDLKAAYEEERQARVVFGD